VTTACWEWDGKTLSLRVKLQPRSQRDAVVGEENGLLKIRVKAAPVENAANLALIKFLSRSLKVGRSQITIRSGAHNRTKLLRISELSEVSFALEKLGLTAP